MKGFSRTGGGAVAAGARRTAGWPARRSTPRLSMDDSLCWEASQSTPYRGSIPYRRSTSRAPRMSVYRPACWKVTAQMACTTSATPPEMMAATNTSTVGKRLSGTSVWTARFGGSGAGAGRACARAARRGSRPARPGPGRRLHSRSVRRGARRRIAAAALVSRNGRNPRPARVADGAARAAARLASGGPGPASPGARLAGRAAPARRSRRAGARWAVGRRHR
eukprot:scaffold16701_cov118-Isochrysis_galbana.AAC.2